MKNPFTHREEIIDIEKMQRVIAVQLGFQNLFAELEANCPQSAELTLSIRNLQQAYAWATVAITQSPDVLP